MDAHTFPVQVKTSVLQQMLRPRNCTSCSSPASGPRTVEVNSYNTFQLCQEGVHTTSRTNAHQIIHMSHNTNSSRRMIRPARSRHNWSEAQLNHRLLQLRLPHRKRISRPVHGYVKFHPPQMTSMTRMRESPCVHPFTPELPDLCNLPDLCKSSV